MRVIIIGTLVATALCACGSDESCGPEDGTSTEMPMSVEGVDGALRYQGFTAAANNDCPIVGSDTAITIQGTQVDSGFPLVLCLSTPESVSSTEPVALDSGPVHLIDISARDVGEGCTLALDRGTEPTLSAAFSGFCGSGVDAAGFSLALSGTAVGSLTCNGQPSTVELVFDGTAVTVAAE